MKSPFLACLLPVAIVLVLDARSSMAEPVAEPCGSFQGAATRACREAFELLTRDVPLPNVDLVIHANLSEGGWQYRFPAPGSEGGGKSECVDRGPLTLPYGISVELSVTSHDNLYEWSVPEVGIDVDIIPGRVESIIVRIDEAGEFEGELVDMSGVRIKAADGSVHALDRAGFDAWRSAIAAVTC